MHNIPPVTRNLLIINSICFLVQMVSPSFGFDITNLFGLHFILASDFNLAQLVTYLFLHANFTHLFFNMFSLWMFGGLIERTLGSKRFLIYFLVCGIGAAICQELWQTAQYYYEDMYLYTLVNTPQGMMPMEQFLNTWTTIGASGACYGILLAFGMLYPNHRIMLLIPPIPMKAKYFVAGYAAIELYSAYASNDNVAHFAHLGGMLFGWLWLRYQMKKANVSHFTRGWEQWNPTVKKSTPWSKIKGLFTPKSKPNDCNADNTSRNATRESDYDYNMRKKAEEARMDEILDKIRQSGYDSLTTEEKQELFRISRR